MICCLNKTVRRSQSYGALLAIQHARLSGADTSPSFSVVAPPSSALLKQIFGIVQFLPVMQSQQIIVKMTPGKRVDKERCGKK